MINQFNLLLCGSKNSDFKVLVFCQYYFNFVVNWVVYKLLFAYLLQRHFLLYLWQNIKGLWLIEVLNYKQLAIIIMTKQYAREIYDALHWTINLYKTIYTYKMWPQVSVELLCIQVNLLSFQCVFQVTC